MSQIASFAAGCARAASSRAAVRASVAVLALVGAFWLVLRFVGLERAPSGYWMDETWESVQAMCLAESGRDADGLRWPLFSSGLAGGTVPLTYTAFDAVWTRLFGTSIAAFRAASAFWNVVTCAALLATARQAARVVPEVAQPPAGDRDAAGTRLFPWLALLAALVSPWSFQFSRIATEWPLGPAFLMVAVASLMRLRTSGNPLSALLGGAAAGLSMISYPPLRAATPLCLALVALALLASAPKGRPRRIVAFRVALMAVASAAAIAPLAIQIARGAITTRMNQVAIFAPEWLDKNRGLTRRLPFFFIALLDNLAVHLRPSYLFFTGDTNTRLSAHVVGQLSPIDVLALALAAGAAISLGRLAARQITRPAAPPAWPVLGTHGQLLVIVAALSAAAAGVGTLPAALTWEGLPHALRSIGAWPFVALLTGAVLALGWSRLRWLPAATALVALVYSAAFVPTYFRVYRRSDPGPFHRDVTDAVVAGLAADPPVPARESLRRFVPVYGDYVLRYYLMHYDKLSCADSAEALRAMRAGNL